MKVTSVFVALAAATVASAARFNMDPLNLRNAGVEVRTQEVHPAVVEREIAPLNATLIQRDVAARNTTVTKRAVAFGNSNSTLFKN
jgi:hypothetical protein